MNCPACKKNNMIVVEFKGVELDHCVDCGGVWFDMDELELLFGALEPGIELPHIADASAEKPRGVREKTRRCPVCRRRMEKVLMGDKDVVAVDHCHEDGGYWFDADELQRVVQQKLPEGGQEKMASFLNSVFHRNND